MDMFEAFRYFGSLYKDETAEKSKLEYDEFDGDEMAKRTPFEKPKTLKDLTDVMNKAVEEDKKLKAVGTRHSLEWSNIAEYEDDVCMIDMSEMNNEILLEDSTTLRNKLPVDKQNLRCFEAGATIEEVQKKLWPLEDRQNGITTDKKVLLNQTGCTQLSLAGTIATAAHGNGLNKPIIADMVRSFRLLSIVKDKDGKLCVNQFQIEPKREGITNEITFGDKFKNVDLVQDDNLFYSSLVNIGCMGVVYSYILEVQPAFYLKENRKIMTLKNAENEIQKLYQKHVKKDETLHSFEIFVCPYPPITTKTNAQDSQEKLSKNDLDGEQVQVVICTLERVNPPKNFNEENSRKRPNLYFIQPEEVRNPFVKACNDLPEVVPLLICLMMNATTCEDVVMDACTALDPLSGLAVSGQVTVSECSMRVNSADAVIKTIKKVIKLYQEIRKKEKSHLATTPFAVRFSKPSKAYMAMQYDKTLPSVMIISNILKGTPGAENTLQKFRECMEKDKGRPHWGMVQDLNEEKLAKLYPEDCIEEFKKAVKELDPHGYFQNSFRHNVFGV